jgi:serine/threonine-protein kinase HipA
MSRKNYEICIGEAEVVVAKLQVESHGEKEYSCFQYTREWLEHPGNFSVSPSLSLNDGKNFFRESPFPPALMDTMPDSWGKSVLVKYSRLNPIPKTRFTSLYFLLAVDDFCRMGALRIREEGRDKPFLANVHAQEGMDAVPGIQDLAKMLDAVSGIENNAPDIAALRHFLYAGSSLGGARPKCSIMDRHGKLAIAKFTSLLDTRAVEKAEALTLGLARLCGIESPNVAIEMCNGLPVAIIERFDRADGKRIPYISAQTMLDCSRADAGTYVDIADAIRKHGNDPKRDLKNLFRRIAFTILVSNVDDHLKNHGFLYSGNGKWRLAPIFDVNPSPERIRRLKTAIADREDASASVELLMEAAFYMEIREDEAARVIAELAKTIENNWEKMAREGGMTRDEIEDFRPAFQHDEANYAKNLGKKRR